MIKKAMVAGEGWGPTQEFWVSCLYWYFKRLNDHNIETLCKSLIHNWLSHSDSTAQDLKYKSAVNPQKYNSFVPSRHSSESLKSARGGVRES